MCRLSSQDGQPPHLAAINRAAEQCPNGCSPADAYHPRQEPIKLVALGRVRSGGVLNGNLPGSAAAAAVVNLYSGQPGESIIPVDKTHQLNLVWLAAAAAAAVVKLYSRQSVEARHAS